MATTLPDPRNPVPREPLFRVPVAAQPANYSGPSAPQAPAYQAPAPPALQQASPMVATATAGEPVERAHPQLILISHSPLFYWWPLWAVGYTLALLSFAQGQLIPIAGTSIKMHPSNNLGVFFVLTLFIVILISNVVVRGLASALVIMTMIALTVIFAYFGWWDAILGWVGELNIYLNQGAYFWIATVMFVVWFFTTFVFDRMSYWRVRPGQITHDFVFGSSARSYGTENMTFEKRRNDVFRHWLLGFGSGDLVIQAFSGGHPEIIDIPNVLFIGSKIRMIQQMIAERPTDIEPQMTR